MPSTHDSKSKPVTIGRNEPCPCGSGKKYKVCCLGVSSPGNASLSHLDPVGLIRARRQAFASRDFGFIYDSYHAESNFRQQFGSREEYMTLGRSSLSQDFDILDYRIIREKIDPDGQQAQVLLYMEVINCGVQSGMFEAILLLKTSHGWRYHSAQKLDRDDFPGPVDTITWRDFERVTQKIIF